MQITYCYWMSIDVCKHKMRKKKRWMMVSAHIRCELFVVVYPDGAQSGRGGGRTEFLDNASRERSEGTGTSGGNIRRVRFCEAASMVDDVDEWG